jgi:rhodanese-related sulfurtransferase
VRRTERVSVDELPARVDAQPDLQLLDVRERDEWAAGHIPGSTLAVWHDIVAVPAGLDPGRPIAVMCASGQRAATAASLLERFGAEQVIHVVDGGVPRWGERGWPLQAGADVSNR